MPETKVTIVRQDSANIEYERSWGFAGSFKVEGDESLTVKRLVLRTEGRLFGGVVRLDQTLIGSSYSQDHKRGLRGAVALAYHTYSGVLDATTQNVGQQVRDYHEATAIRIEEASRRGVLPIKIRELERI